MIGDVLIQSREVADQWLVTVAVLESTDPREGPLYRQVSAVLDRDKLAATTGAVHRWLILMGEERR